VTLRKQSTPARRGFSLLEVLIAVAIIVLIASAGGYMYMSHFENAKKDLAKAAVMALDQEVQIYRTRHGDFPPSLDVLTQRGPSGEAATIEVAKLVDPWNRPIAYEPQNLHPLSGKPHIYTEGPNPGTPGSRISNWEGNQ